MSTKILTKEEFSKFSDIMYQDYKETVQTGNFYDFEKSMVAFSRDLILKLMQHSVGAIPKDRRKKKA
ncbi:MAG: hypothetical protein ORN85_00715 [Sediminibacterium sp.]|jgi:hypothetical protein|nr:hypothetical protein [Sediminibacterium sp.]